MKLHPWQEVCDNAERCIAKGADIYQQWNCQHCGAKQTMPDKNVLYTFGICEECKKVTDIKAHGHNFSAHFRADNEAMMEYSFGGKK
jgi:hypothetical protein